MARVSRVPLSGDSTGLPLLVTPVTTPGETVHVATTKKVNGYDLLTLHAQNNHTAAVDLSIEITDGTSTVTMLIAVPAKSVANDLLKDLMINEGVTVKAFASSADKITLSGFCNQVDLHAADPYALG